MQQIKEHPWSLKYLRIKKLLFHRTKRKNIFYRITVEIIYYTYVSRWVDPLFF